MKKHFNILSVSLLLLTSFIHMPTQAAASNSNQEKLLRLIFNHNQDDLLGKDKSDIKKWVNAYQENQTLYTAYHSILRNAQHDITQASSMDEAMKAQGACGGQSLKAAVKFCAQLGIEASDELHNVESCDEKLDIDELANYFLALQKPGLIDAKSQLFNSNSPEILKRFVINLPDYTQKPPLCEQKNQHNGLLSYN